jgi:hypothetical protein
MGALLSMVDRGQGTRNPKPGSGASVAGLKVGVNYGGMPMAS